MGGCASSSKINTPQQISIQMRRLKHKIDSKIQNLRDEGLTSQKILLVEFKKEKAFRAAAAEMAIANQITIKQNKIQIYDIIKGHVQKLIDYHHHLGNPDKAKESLYPSFKIILYSQSILKDENIDSFCQAIRKRYPDITQAEDIQIDSELMKHYKKSQLPLSSMINEYLLNLVHQQNLNLEEINKVGHNIRYGG